MKIYTLSENGNFLVLQFCISSLINNNSALQIQQKSFILSVESLEQKYELLCEQELQICKTREFPAGPFSERVYMYICIFYLILCSFIKCHALVIVSVHGNDRFIIVGQVILTLKVRPSGHDLLNLCM